MTSSARRRVCILGLSIAITLCSAVAVWAEEPAENPAAPLRVVVMDPLCKYLACDCAGDYAQRDYDALEAYLQSQLQRSVEIVYSEALAAPQVRLREGVDLIIGKYSVVAFDAAAAKVKIRTLAMLTGADGTVTQTGLFVVRTADPARSIADLADYQIIFGPKESNEKRAAAFAAVEAFGLLIPDDVPTSSACNTAALAVFENEAGAAVISSYAMPLLEGCGTIDPGSLRIVGRTDPVPFITVFATDRVDPTEAKSIVKALTGVARSPELLTAMQSKHGFVALPAFEGDADKASAIGAWNDWRGPRRDAISDRVPLKLPAECKMLWSHILTGPGMAGVAVDGRHAIVVDKSLDGEQDVFRCLDADSGDEIWKLTYPAPGEMDFTNSPRANPVIHNGVVYLLGAFGDLHCVRLDSGKVLWKMHLANDFGAKLPMWGYSSTPLVLGDKLIVNPGAKTASLAALDRLTGEVLWATPGDPPGYSAFILATLGGVRQIVGYDVASLGGWDPETGRRLWRLVPDYDGDFNVPTPIVLHGKLEGKLLVSTENNGTRIYAFDEEGKIIEKPLALNEDLNPDTSSPVVIDGLVFGSCNRLVCLDLHDGLKTLWEVDDDPFMDYAALIAGNGRVLAITQIGELCLMKATKTGYETTGTVDLFKDVPDTERDVWSHPALIGNRLYIRNLLAVYCFLIE